MMNNKTENRSWLMLFYFVLLCLLVEAISGWFTSMSLRSWYPLLQKPVWNPPRWVFAPTWTVLYLLMAVAIWLVWKEKNSPWKETAYKCFAVQLLLNLLWTPLFFGLQCPLCALIDIIILWIFIVATLISFYAVRPVAGWLLVPYLLWVSYALTLNAAIWYLN